MAYCTNCGHTISDQALSCPKCGQPMGEAGPGAGELADFWSRLGAYLLDALVVLIPAILLGLVVPFGGIAVIFLYDWLMHAYYDGQTVGKRAVNIRVTRPDGSPIDPTVSAARAGMEIVSGFPFWLGYLWAAWDPERRTWHDMVADTRVYRVR